MAIAPCWLNISVPGYSSEMSLRQAMPAVADKAGGTALTVVSGAGVEDGASMWCLLGGVTVVQSGSVASGAVECMTVASVAGNTTVAVSSNAQDWSSSSVMTELVPVANVSSVSPSVVSSTASSVVTVQGLGMMMRNGAVGTYCAVGGSSVDQSAWGYTMGTVVSSSSVECMVSARGSGMQVLEVSLGEGGVLSHSGAQLVLQDLLDQL
mgnify:CR=1 FL=1